LGAVSLFAVGFLAATLLWLGLVWVPRRLAPVDALRAFAAARGLGVRGDGVSLPITIVGEASGRPFTVTWQRHWLGGDVLLLGVDCAAAADGPVVLPIAGPIDRMAGPMADPGADPRRGTPPGGASAPVSEVGDAALVTRWVRPAPDVLDPARLGAILDAMARMAEELEESSPAEDRDYD
jgi:hypothetical protein